MHWSAVPMVLASLVQLSCAAAVTRVASEESGDEGGASRIMAPAEDAGGREVSMAEDAGGREVSMADRPEIASLDSAAADRADIDGARAPISSCRDKGLFLCDDFESGVLDPAVWTKIGSPEVDETRPRHGRYALHSHQRVCPPGGQVENRVRNRTIFPLPGNSYWGRLWLYMKADKAPDSNSTFFEFGEKNHSNIYGMTVYFGHLHTVFLNTKGPFVHGGPTVAAAYPLNKWTCMEWQQDGRPGHDEMRVWMDGVEQSALHITTYKIPPGFELFLGAKHYDSSGREYDEWIDDFALGASRIGCGE